MANQSKAWHVMNPVAVNKLLHSPVGPVARDLIKRGVRVQTRARRNLGGSTGVGPKRVDTGLLRASIATQLRTDGTELAVRVGTNVRYSRWVHDGTGIYGPRGLPIRPKHKKFLRWYSKGGQAIFRRQVAGMKPNPYLKAALPAYRASSSGA